MLRKSFIYFVIHVHKQGQLEHTEKFLSTLLADLGNILAASTSINYAWARVLHDPFLRQLVLRYAASFEHVIEYVPSLPEALNLKLALPCGLLTEALNW